MATSTTAAPRPTARPGAGLGARLRNRVLTRWAQFRNFTLRHKTVGGTAELMAEKFGEAPFCLFEGESFSFAEFNRRANRRAHLFRSLDVRRGDAVCLLMENRPEYLETLVGLAKLGAVTAAINTHQRGQALLHSINLSRAALIVVGAECLPQLVEVLPHLERIGADGILVDTRWGERQAGPSAGRPIEPLLAACDTGNPPPEPLTARSLLMFIFTSGTTGLPKAVRVTHLRWYLVGLALLRSLMLRRGDTIFCPLPLYHSNAALVAFGGALVNGVRLALSRKFSVRSFWEEVRATDATAFIYIGELLRYLLNAPPSPADRNHQVTRIFGNGLRGDIWRAFQERFGISTIREFYASSEGNVSTINLDGTPGSVGKPNPLRPQNWALVRCVPATGEHLRDDTGFAIPCAPGEVGELLGEVTPATPFPGYTSEEETERKLLRNVLRAGDVYFRTGDLLTRDLDGNFYFVDRIGDTFRWKGENVSTEEVQKIVSGFEGVGLANVYGVTLPGADGRACMAALTLDNGKPFDGAAFYRLSEAHLAPYARPAFVRIAPDLEVTSTFKLRKPELREQGFDPARMSDPLYFRDDAARTYTPLDQAALARINAGSVRF